MSESEAPATNTAKLRWARAQRFRLTGKGAEGLKAWRAAMEKVQGADGRMAFDAVRIEWAKQFAVQAEDGLLVSELSGAPMRLEDLLKGAPAGDRVVLLKVDKEILAQRFEPVIEAISEAGGELFHVVEEKRK